MSGAVISHLCRILTCVLLSLTGSHCNAAPIRIAAWNTANRPNDAKDEQAFRTALHTMGTLDILAVSETDGGSSQALATLMNDVFSVESFGVTTSSPDAGGDRTGFLFNSDTVSLGQSTELNAGLTHNILSGQFRPIGTTEDIVVYSMHLKSGDGEAAAIRAAEAEVIRNHADSLGDSVNVLFAGDFNMQGSSEMAWTQLTADGNAQVFDVANAPGAWHDNVDFLSLHTQDPGRKMDDRFDLMMASQELFDGIGLDYVDGSFHVFGNDSSHALGGSIDTGTALPPDVLSALSVASDHLPMIAEFQILPSFEPGDADRDSDFDQSDLILVQQTGKYHSEMKATWREGDWNGDELFDQRDIVAALVTGNYLTGPYASTKASVESIPEPNSMVILTIGLLGLIVFGWYKRT